MSIRNLKPFICSITAFLVVYTFLMPFATSPIHAEYEPTCSPSCLQFFENDSSIDKQYENKGRIAILDFRAHSGVSAGEAQTIADLIRVHFVNFAVFTVIERSNIKEVLREQAFQQSGCTDTSCAVKVGRLLAADKIMIGSVAKIESTYIITTRIIDVNKGRIDFAETISYLKAEELNLKTEDLARKITSRILGLKENTFIKFTKEQRKKANLETLKFAGLGHFQIKRDGFGYFFLSTYAGSFFNLIFYLPYKVRELRRVQVKEQLAIMLIYAMTKFSFNSSPDSVINNPLTPFIFTSGVILSGRYYKEKITDTKYNSYIAPFIIMGITLIDLNYYFFSLGRARVGANLKYDHDSGSYLGLVFRYRF